MGGGPRDSLGGPVFNLSASVSPGGRLWKLLRGPGSRPWVPSSYLVSRCWQGSVVLGEGDVSFSDPCPHRQVAQQNPERWSRCSLARAGGWRRGRSPPGVRKQPPGLTHLPSKELGGLHKPALPWALAAPPLLQKVKLDDPRRLCQLFEPVDHRRNRCDGGFLPGPLLSCPYFVSEAEIPGLSMGLRKRVFASA